MKSPEERGQIGAWAYDARVSLDMSVEQVIERLPTRYHPATLRKVESGSAQPGRRMLRELETLYGSSPEALQATESGDQLAAAIRALTDELRAWRTEDRARLAEVEVTVGRLVEERLTAAAAAGSQGHAALHGSKG